MSSGLKFIQVSSDVFPRIQRLANTTGQHPIYVCGALVHWWHGFEFAEIDKAATSDDGSIIIDADRLRLQMKQVGLAGVEPADLIEACFLEPTNDGKFRVRGMSRYIDTARKLQHYRANAAKGGAASAATRAAASGRAKSKQAASKPQANREACIEANSKQPLDQTASNVQQDVRRKTLDVKAITPSLRSGVARAGAREADPAPSRELSDALSAAFQSARGSAYEFAGSRDGAALRELVKLDALEVMRRWRLALANDGFPRVSSLHELVTNWNHFAGDGPAKPQGRTAMQRIDPTSQPSTDFGPPGRWIPKPEDIP